MKKYITPIFDRTADDVANQTQKAFFNVADWLRIKNNIGIVHDLMVLLLNADIDLSNTITPTITSFPSAGDLNQLLGNIEAIRQGSRLPAINGLAPVASNWQNGSSTDSPDYEDANLWERVLNIVYNSTGKAVDYSVFCGVSNVGQSRFYQNRWRRYAWVKPAATPVRNARANVATCGSGLTRNNSFRRY